MEHCTDVTELLFLNIYQPVTAPNGTNPAIIVTLTPMGTRTGDVDLVCSPGTDPDILRGGQGQFVSAWLQPPREGPADIGSALLLPGSLRLPTADCLGMHCRCCQGRASCLPWKQASQGAGAELDTDLCQFGTCDEEGRLTALDTRGQPGRAGAQGALAGVQYRKGCLRLHPSCHAPLQGDINEAATALSALRNLQEWAASASNLTGTLDDSTAFCNLTQGVLEALLIDGNGINGSLQACLFNSTLYQFSAPANSLAGSIPDAFASSARLQSFAMAGNKLTGTIPPSLATAPGLVQVDLSYNYLLSGLLPLFTSSSLASLDLKYNQLTGTVPEAYAGHPSLYRLDLKENQLTALPQKWFDSPALDERRPLNFFRISFNRLEGGFPTALATYPDLYALVLNNNKLSGPLPDPQPGEFPSLRALNLAENEFNGTLGEGWEGTGIFQLPPLGPLPDSWNAMNLSTNQLTGAVPGFIANQAYPVNVILDGNDFSTGAAFQPVETSDQGAIPSNSASSGGGLSSGAIAGIVVGVIVAVGLASITAFAVVRRSRRRNFTQAGGNSSKFSHFD
ncbi:hypothetical protein ABPG75_006436 [Micractinium tetrahymenae]